MVKLIVVATAVAGAYFLFSQVSFMHKFAFGLGGMGFSYLAIGCIVLGFVAFRATK